MARTRHRKENFNGSVFFFFEILKFIGFTVIFSFLLLLQKQREYILLFSKDLRTFGIFLIQYTTLEYSKRALFMGTLLLT